MWYKVFNWIDSKLKKASFGNTEPGNLDTTLLEMGKPSPATTKEVKLGAYLAALAGISGLVLILSMGVVITTFSNLEKTGRSRPDSEFLAFMIGMPIVIALIYSVIRHFIIKRVSNEVREDSMDKQNTVTNPDAKTDASMPTGKDQQGESWF